MPIEVRQRTISVKLAGEVDWTTRYFGETLPTLDPYEEITPDVEAVKVDICDYRGFFINHGSGKLGHGLSRNAPESGISVDGVEEDGHHVIMVRIHQSAPKSPFRSIEHRFYLYPNNVGIKRDVDFTMRADERVKNAPDLAMSENVIAQKFVTQEDLVHLNYVKAVLQQD